MSGTTSSSSFNHHTATIRNVRGCLRSRDTRDEQVARIDISGESDEGTVIAMDYLGEYKGEKVTKPKLRNRHSRVGHARSYACKVFSIFTVYVLI